MKKDITIVRDGLVIDIGRFERSNIDGWVAIYSRAGERIGGFSLSDRKLKIIHKFTQDDTLYLTYALMNRRLDNEY